MFPASRILKKCFGPGDMFQRQRKITCCLIVPAKMVISLTAKEGVFDGKRFFQPCFDVRKCLPGMTLP